MALFISSLHLVLLLTVIITAAQAQTCYYPNGDITSVDAPCPNSDLCCPLHWQCLSNGMCYYPANDYYERRTCVDKSWNSTDCPKFCTYSDAGNEAMLQCDDGTWCCDGNRVSIDCCKDGPPAGTSYMDIEDGTVVGSISALSLASTLSSTAAASHSSDNEAASSQPVEDATSSSTSSLGALATATSSSTRPATASSGIVSASQNVSFPAPSSGADTDHHDHSSSNAGALAGALVGLFAVGGLVCLVIYFRDRLDEKWRKNLERMGICTQRPSSPSRFNFSEMLMPSARAREIDSMPVAATNRTSELQGSDVYGRYSTVSSMSPGAQGYSPQSMVSPVVSSGDGSGGPMGRMGPIEEKTEPTPAELWGGPVYRPYRPGLENQGVGGNV